MVTRKPRRKKAAKRSRGIVYAIALSWAARESTGRLSCKTLMILVLGLTGVSNGRTMKAMGIEPCGFRPVVAGALRGARCHPALL